MLRRGASALAGTTAVLAGANSLAGAAAPILSLKALVGPLSEGRTLDKRVAFWLPFLQQWPVARPLLSHSPREHGSTARVPYPNSTLPLSQAPAHPRPEVLYVALISNGLARPVSTFVAEVPLSPLARSPHWLHRWHPGAHGPPPQTIRLGPVGRLQG